MDRKDGDGIMKNIDILGTNEYINDLCDWIDEQWAMVNLWHGYVNDPIDTDKDGCFV